MFFLYDMSEPTGESIKLDNTVVCPYKTHRKTFVIFSFLTIAVHGTK